MSPTPNQGYCMVTRVGRLCQALPGTGESSDCSRKYKGSIHDNSSQPPKPQLSLTHYPALLVARDSPRGERVALSSKST